jgi:hypothetical protein
MPSDEAKFEPGARMIMDAILLTVAEISTVGTAKLPVAIFPELRIATGDGVNVVNPTTGFKLWLTGQVDYGLCTYIDGSMRRKDWQIRYILSCTNQSPSPGIGFCLR